MNLYCTRPLRALLGFSVVPDKLVNTGSVLLKEKMRKRFLSYLEVLCSALNLHAHTLRWTLRGPHGVVVMNKMTENSLGSFPPMPAKLLNTAFFKGFPHKEKESL